jgi:hypothetical protein
MQIEASAREAALTETACTNPTQFHTVKSSIERGELWDTNGTAVTMETSGTKQRFIAVYRSKHSYGHLFSHQPNVRSVTEACDKVHCSPTIRVYTVDGKLSCQEE